MASRSTTHKFTAREVVDALIEKYNIPSCPAEVTFHAGVRQQWNLDDNYDVEIRSRYRETNGKHA